MGVIAGAITTAVSAIGSFLGGAVADVAGAFGLADAAGAGAGAAGLGAGLGLTDATADATFGLLAPEVAAADAGFGVPAAAGAGSAFGGGLISDAAGGATVAQGVPLVSTYGPVSAFSTDAGLGAATTGAGAGAGSAFGDIASDAAGGATVSEGVPLASTYGPVSTFATDLGAGSVGDTAGALGGAPSIGTGAGVSTSTPLPASAPALSVSPTAPGPGGAALAPPTQALAQGGVVDPTTALAQSQGGSLITLDDTASPVASASDAPIQGAAGLNPGSPLTPDTLQASVDEAGVPPSPPTGGAFGAQVSNFFSPVTNAVDSAGNFLSSPTGKLLGTGISAIGLGHSLLEAANPNPIPGEAQLASLAQQLGNEGAALIQPNAAASEKLATDATEQAATLENYLTTGTLPPAVEAALNQATQSAITDIQGQYAARGMPPRSPAELDDIEAVKQDAVIQGGTLAASLYSQGVSLDQLASQITTGLVGAGTGAAGAGVGAEESVVGTNTAINTGLNNAISNLASALGGGSKVIVNGNTVAVPA